MEDGATFCWLLRISELYNQVLNIQNHLSLFSNGSFQYETPCKNTLSNNARFYYYSPTGNRDDKKGAE